MATLYFLASRIVDRITGGSPAWNPQAMLADVMKGMTASSLPSLYCPKLSPRSQLRSIFMSPRNKLRIHNTTAHFFHHYSIFFLCGFDGFLAKSNRMFSRRALC